MARPASGVVRYGTWSRATHQGPAFEEATDGEHDQDPRHDAAGAYALTLASAFLGFPTRGVEMPPAG